MAAPREDQTQPHSHNPHTRGEDRAGDLREDETGATPRRPERRRLVSVSKRDTSHLESPTHPGPGKRDKTSSEHDVSGTSPR